MLLQLASNLPAPFKSIIGLLKIGWLQRQIHSAGIPYVVLNEGRKGDLNVLVSLLKVLSEHPIQLIHAHEFYMGLIGAVASRLTGIPLVVTVHGKSYYPDKYRRRLLYRMVAGQAARIVAVSQDLQRFLCRTIGLPLDRVQVSYNGIKLDLDQGRERDPKLRQAVGIPVHAMVVGTVGNLYPVKGQIHLIRAARLILDKEPNTHFVILGRGGLREALLAEAEALGVEKHTHFLGYCDNVCQWLREMDVFTLPSLSEGLPLSLLEAMAAGVPTVVTEVGGMPEVVQDGHSGYIVPPGDPSALAHTILFLLDDPMFSRELGMKGRNRIRSHFSLNKMVDEYSAIYRGALSMRFRSSGSKVSN